MKVADALEEIRLSAASIACASSAPGGTDVTARTTSSSSAGARAEARRRGALARAGLRTLLLDAAIFPRVKICAGWVTPEALADVEVDPEKYPLTIQPFTRVPASASTASIHETRWRRPASYGIVRSEFDHHLLDRARVAGAETREGARVTAVTREGDAIRVASERGAFAAPVVVGAGGHHCPVAKAFGEVSEREEVVGRPGERDAAARRAPRSPARLRDRARALRRAGPQGLRLVLPEGGRAQHRHRRRRRARREPAAAPGGARRRAARLGPPARRPGRSSRSAATPTSCGAGRRGVSPAPASVSIGDAAGLARDLSGEGIGPAIRSGLLGRGGRRRARAARRLRSTRTRSAIVRRYGRGETGWLGRQLGRLPDAIGRDAWCGLCWPPAPRGVTWSSAESSGCGRCRREAAGKADDARAIAHHYDVSNEFYALFLDPLMVYTCAYYRDPDGKLEQAQQDKLDHVCRKLELQPRRDAARHRMRLGQPGDLGGPALRRARPRRDASRGPRPTTPPSASAARGSQRSVSRRVPGLPRTCRPDVVYDKIARSA